MEYDCGAYKNILSNKVKSRLDSAISDFRITGVQSRFIFYILTHYKKAPVFQRDIENAYRIGRSTATGVLNLMEKNGLIVRQSVDTDARLKSLIPTKKAEELNERVREILKETDSILTRGLSDENIALFKEVAKKMILNLEEFEDSHKHGCRIE